MGSREEVDVTTRKKASRKKASPGPVPRDRGRRWLGWTFAAVVVAAVLAVPVARWAIGRDEGNLLLDGFGELEDAACIACHRQPDGRWRWHADGTPPVSLEVIRDAIFNGRDAVPGFAEAMPAYAGRLEHEEWLGAQHAVAVLAGLEGVPEDPELAAGHDVARDMGCFGCHGPLGEGGVANPGSLAGRIPGWYGGRYRKAAEREGGIQAVIREGSRPIRVPVPGLAGPLLTMPAWGDRIDSTELEVLTAYLRWLHENPPGE